jgi:hypothetical protein
MGSSRRRSSSNATKSLAPFCVWLVVPKTRDADPPENQKSSDARHTGKRDSDRTIFPMPKLPELMIGYDSNHFPIAAVCYGCGAGMPKPDPTLTRSEDVIAWFSSAFAVHKEGKHTSSIDLGGEENRLLE